MPDIYVPLGYWKRLVKTPAAKGKRGGTVVYAETFGRRRFTPTHFIDMVGRGYDGWINSKCLGSIRTGEAEVQRTERVIQSNHNATVRRSMSLDKRLFTWFDHL